MIVGAKTFSSLLYPLNLRDWPNLDCISLSPSYNFNGFIWVDSKYSPNLLLLSPSPPEFGVPVDEVSP